MNLLVCLLILKVEVGFIFNPLQFVHFTCNDMTTINSKEKTLLFHKLDCLIRELVTILLKNLDDLLRENTKRVASEMILSVENFEIDFVSHAEIIA